MWGNLTTSLVGFAGHLLGGLKLAASFIFARVLTAAGLTFASYNYVLPDVKAFVVDKAGLLSSEVSGLLGAMGLDVFMIMILSATVAKVGMRAFLVGINQLQGMIDQAGG